jgi:mono/diheme cytochrome c family protein
MNYESALKSFRLTLCLLNKPHMKKLALTFSTILVAASLPLSAFGKVDFAKDISPILQSCVECHGDAKQKGDLRLDTREAALKGGKDGVVLVPGDAEKSDVYKRIILPKGHDDVMPPKGEPLSKAQTDLIKQWIAEGAEWPGGATIKPAAGAAAHASAEPVKRPDHKPSPAEMKAVATLEAAGVSIRPIAQNQNWREASFRGLGTNATDTTIAPVKDIAGLVDLNLAGTKISDGGLAAIKGLINLNVLHLEHTGITDAGLANLKDLQNLEYLNLFDTKVTDAGLKQVEGLKKLKNVYLWQTKVTDAGIDSLRKTLPGARIQTGWDTNAVAKKEEAPAPKK